MAFYECVFIARQELSQAQVEAIRDELKTTLKDQGAKVSRQEYWGLRRLAYPIQKNSKGHYVLMNITASSAAISEVERKMRLNEDILRFLTVRVEKLEEGPSVVMRQQNESEDEPALGVAA